MDKLAHIHRHESSEFTTRVTLRRWRRGTPSMQQVHMSSAGPTRSLQTQREFHGVIHSEILLAGFERRGGVGRYDIPQPATAL